MRTNTAHKIIDVIAGIPAEFNVDTELITLTLHTSVDGKSWNETAFEGESAIYVDACATTFITEMRDSLGMTADDTTDWSKFPHAFDALFELASQHQERRAAKKNRKLAAAAAAYQYAPAEG